MLQSYLLSPLAETDPGVSHWVNPASTSLHGSALQVQVLHTECIQLVGGLVWECLLMLTCSLILSLPQGFHDQPGVEPQWILSAQCCHNFFQPITIQLNDLQVEPGSWGCQSKHYSHSLTEANSPTALPHHFWTLFLLHNQSLQKWGMFAQDIEEFKNSEAKRFKIRLCVQIKGLIFAQRSYFLCLASVLGSSLNQNISRMCVLFGREGSTERWKKQYSHSGSYETSWRHWRRCYIMHSQLHLRTEMVHTSSFCTPLKKNGCAVT